MLTSIVLRLHMRGHTQGFKPCRTFHACYWTGLEMVDVKWTIKSQLIGEEGGKRKWHWEQTLRKPSIVSLQTSKLKRLVMTEKTWILCNSSASASCSNFTVAGFDPLHNGIPHSTPHRQGELRVCCNNHVQSAAAMCCMTLMSCFHYASNLRVKPLGGFRKTEHHDHVSLSVAYVRRSPPQTSDGWQLITSLKMKCCLYISSFSPSLAFSLTRIYSRCSHTDVQFADDVLH